MAAAEQIITENLATWTSAVQARSAAGRGKSRKLELYGIKKLRELILELAVRGLLVSQDPNDEPANELLKKIDAEKAKLTEEGKAKKKRKQLPKEVEEPPFIVPGGWEWTPLEQLFDIQDHIRIPLNKAERASREGVYAYYGANGQVGTIDDYLFEGVRILVAEDGGFFKDPIRGVAYIAEGKFWVNNHAHVLECLGGTPPGFWVSYFNQLNWEPLVRGMTRDKLNQSAMRAIALPVPPLAEQRRIVAKVDELMALCDQLEQQQEASITAHQTLVQTLLDALTTASERDGFAAAWARIADHFDTLFTTEWSIDQLKQAILQLAVMGKIVQQDPNDEPASELLKEIAAEKAQLVKDGKIKKQKVLPPIEFDEKPFELPEGWEWARLGDVCTKLTDGSHNPPPNSGDGYPMLSCTEVNYGRIDFSSPSRFVTEEDFHRENKRTAIKPGDILLNIAASIGRSAIVPPDAPKFVLQRNVAAIDSRLYSRYLVNHLGAPLCLEYFEEYAKGTAQKIIYLGKLSLMPIAISPLAEQKRIVAKLDELMALCDELVSSINQAESIELKLADAVAQHVVA